MIYSFGTICVNTQHNQLSINGEAVDVDERILKLILELLSHYPNHCSKAELLQILWPDTVVSEWSISKLVSDARQAFKQHGFKQEIIQTLHGRGYRLASELGDQLKVSQDDASKTTTDAPRRKPFFSRQRVMLATVVGFVLLILIYVIANRGSSHLQKSEPAKSIGRLLWVDDHPENNLTEKAYLENFNITVYQVTSSEDALTSLALYQYDVVVSDMGRNGEVLAGLNLLKAMRKDANDTPFLLYTIVLSQAQQKILQEYEGQGVAVEPDKLYEMVLPFFPDASPQQ